MNGPDTDPLLLGLAAGDQRAFVVLYDRFAVRMYRAAVRMLGSREDAEDVVQDVFLAAVRSRKRLGDVRDLTAYLFAALHRAAGRCAHAGGREPCNYRPRASMKRLPGGAARRTTRIGSGWNRRFAHLPDEQREVLTLKIDGELTFAQIAQVIGVSVSTAAAAISTP